MAYASALVTLPADRPRLTRLIAFLLGAMTTLAFEPFGLSLLAPLLLVPLLHVFVTAAPRDAAGHAFWYGIGLFLTGTYWIYISVVDYGNAAPWLALLLMLGLALIMALWLFIAGWIISRLGHGEPLRVLAVAPAAWVLIEWLRGWVLTGFPWLAFGYAFVDSGFAGWAPVAGVYGVSFAVVLSAAGLLTALANPGFVRWVGLFFVFAPWISGALLTLQDWTEDDGPALRATVLQFGIAQDQKWRAENRQRTLDYYRDGTRIVQTSDIVVWPEVAIPSTVGRQRAYLAQLESDARESGQNIVFGILEDEIRIVETPDDETAGEAGDDAPQALTETLLYNSVILINASGRQVYRKRHLVPFGEYFPVPDNVRAWMSMQSLPNKDLAAGSDVQPLLETSAGTRLAVMICYEDAYGSEQLYALPDAGVLINVSNDAWFGDSIAPHQHLQIARMRSLEFGRPTIRATNTGISAFIDHEGELVRTGEQFREVAMTESVQPRRGSTPYVGSGNLPVLALCLAILAVFWARAGR